MAAVGCRICEILPPSSSRPATMPPTPTASPAKLLLSTAGLRCAGRRIGEAVGISKFVAAGAEGAILSAAHDGAAKLQDAVDHLSGGFTHHELLAVEQRDDRVRRLLDVLNKVGVERQAGIVQAGELDHRRPRLGERLSEDIGKSCRALELCWRFECRPLPEGRVLGVADKNRLILFPRGEA